MSVNAIARQLRLDKSTASRAVTTLVELGLARRMEDPQEHRAWRIVLTSKGRAAVERGTGRVKEQLRPVLNRLSPDARRKLTRVIREVAILTRQRVRGLSKRTTAKPS